MPGDEIELLNTIWSQMQMNRVRYYRFLLRALIW